MRKSVKSKIAMMMSAAVVLATAVVGFTASADTAATLTVGDASAKAGEEVTVEVSVADFDSVSGIQFEIEADGLEFVSATSGAVTLVASGNDQNYVYNSETGVFKIVEVAEVSNGALGSFASNGVLFSLTYVIPEEAEAGTAYDVTVSEAKFANSNAALVAVETANGAVTVDESTPEYIVGDMNSDGGVTSDDAIYLLNATFDEETYPLTQPADFNRDGGVTSDDAIYLLNATFDEETYPLNPLAS